MMSASEQLQTAAIAALEKIQGLSVYPGPPLQAAVPYATVEAGLESDWGHKSGDGREVRFAITIRDKGQLPNRVHRLVGQAQATMAALGASPGTGGADWRLVTIRLSRSRVVADGKAGWAAVIEYRARMLGA